MTESEEKPLKATDAGAAALIDGSLAPHATNTPLIRLGEFGDVGYIVPVDLPGNAACHSPDTSVARPPDRRHNPRIPALALPGRWIGETVTE